MTRILSLAVCSAITRKTVTFVTTPEVGAVPLLARLIFQALIDVDLAMLSNEAGVGAVAAETGFHVGTVAPIARVIRTLINIRFALTSGVARWTGARISLKRNK